MAKKRKRTTMRKVREILRLHYESRLSNQQIADALRISKTGVFNILGKFREAGMSWPVSEDLSGTELEARIYRKSSSKEKTESQNGQDWVKSHIRAIQYFRCVPNAFVPDNLKSGVTKASFYEPEINALYEKFAQHYDTVILPARVRKPKDKPVVESNILHLQRFIFGRLRNCTFSALLILIRQ